MAARSSMKLRKESLPGVLPNTACNFIEKETQVQVFSCELCKNFKNIFFIKHIWVTAYTVPDRIFENTLTISI